MDILPEWGAKRVSQGHKMRKQWGVHTEYKLPTNGPIKNSTLAKKVTLSQLATPGYTRK